MMEEQIVITSNAINNSINETWGVTVPKLKILNKIGRSKDRRGYRAERLVNEQKRVRYLIVVEINKRNYIWESLITPLMFSYLCS